MSFAVDLHNLQEQKRSELALLRTRMSAIADTLEHEASPAQWIREHPYVGTAGAAMIGLVAAQLPGKCAFPAPPPPPQPAPTPPPPAAAKATPYAGLLEFVLNLARQFLQSEPESPPASFAIANAGAVAGPDFPQFLSPECRQNPSK